jgi:hypothetical protein
VKSASEGLWIGVAAITAGVLLFLSNLFSEFLLPGEKDGEIVRLGLGLVYIAAYGVGAVALVLALRGLSTLHRRRGELTRAGHNGLRVAAAGAALQALFAAVYFATAAATGDAVDAAFFLYALGFLLLIGGSLTAGVSMIRTGVQRPVGALLLVAGAMAIVTIVTPAPVHDVGLFLFDTAWIGVGLLLIRPLRWESVGRRVPGWSSALGLLVALSVPTGALASASVETIHFGGSMTQAAENPCTGAQGTASGTFKGVSHTNVTPTGSMHHTATVTGETVFTPNDPSEPTYTGRFTAWDGQNVALGATITSTATFHDMLFGSDGSRIRARGVFHVTQLADGTVTAAVDTFVLVCETG